MRELRKIQTGDVISAAYGALFALYLLSGRWGFDRLFGETQPAVEFYYELRYWIVLGLLTIFIHRAPFNAGPGRRPGRFLKVTVVTFLAYYLLSYFWAPSSEYADDKARDMLLMGLSTLAFLRALSLLRSASFEKGFWLTLLAASVFVGFAAMVSPDVLDSGARLSALGGGANVFVRIMGYLAIATLYVSEHYKVGFLAFPLVGIAGVLAILSGSRGGIIAFVCVIAAYVVIAVSRRKMLLAALISLLVLFAVGLRSTAVGALVQERIDVRIKKLLFEERYGAGREQLYWDAVHLGLESPVWGTGLGSFRARGLGTYPHNIVLETFCEVGVVGVALLAAVLVLSFTIALRAPLGDSEPWLLGLVLILVASQFSGDMYDSRAIFLFALGFQRYCGVR